MDIEDPTIQDEMNVSGEKQKDYREGER